jgi:hypothetical protein
MFPSIKQQASNYIVIMTSRNVQQTTILEMKLPAL